MEKVNKDVNGCWNWTGAKNNQGYGNMSVNNSVQLVHRLMFKETSSQNIDDLCVLHKCDNTSCIKPDHLFSGNKMDNTIDMILKGRLKSATLVKEDIPKIKEMHNAGISYKDIAKVFPVKACAIRRVISGQTWSHF